MINLIEEIKKKREFSGLPDSIVKKVLDNVNSDLDEKSKVKEARSLLRKYFGVFLTNKVIKPKDILDYESVLKSHKSSMKRDYNALYERFEKIIGKVDSVIDFGCGVNGFSYEFLKKYFGDVKYFGIEASNQIVENMNSYFDKKSFQAEVFCLDLFDLKKVNEVILRSDVTPKGVQQKGARTSSRPSAQMASTKADKVGKKIFFCFQVVDALEKLERDFSKKFLLNLKESMNEKDFIVISLPMVSLSSKSEFKIKRNWLFEFLEKEFEKIDDFKMFGERFIILSKVL